MIYDKVLYICNVIKNTYIMKTTLWDRLSHEHKTLLNSKTDTKMFADVKLKLQHSKHLSHLSLVDYTSLMLALNLSGQMIPSPFTLFNI